ncbi:unnamed protein product, partial [marine sediment metagenome]
LFQAVVDRKTDSHREEIRTLKEDREHLTESLWLREYGEKIRKLINAN